MSQSWPDVNETSSITDFITALRKVGGDPEEKDKEQTGAWQTTPYSLQDLKSGATLLSKLWALAVGAAGGLSALLAIFEGLFNDLGGSKTDVPLVRAAFIISGAVLLSVVSIAVALIVRGDVTARATSHAARATAEGEIVSAVLETYGFSFPPPAPAPTQWLVQKKDGTFLKIDKFSWSNDNLVLVTTTGDILHDGDWSGIIDCRDITPSPAPADKNGSAAAS